MKSDCKRELIALSQQGDIQSFSILFDQIRPALYAKALQFLGQRPEVEDVLQDTFIKAFTKIGQLRDAGKFNTWIHTVLKNECLLMKRSRSRFQEDKIPLDHRASDLQPFYLERLLEEAEFRWGVMQWLSHLDERKQAVTLLRFFSEYSSYREIATLLAIPIGTVRSRLAIAKKELQQKLEKIGGIPQLGLSGGGQSEYGNMFRDAWPAFYQGERQRFLALFCNDISIRFTSGKMSRGLQRWAREWDQDLESGVRFRPNQIINSGSLAIVEGPIINPPDKPHHCPPYGSMVLFHKEGKVHRTHVHYAPASASL